MMGQASPWHREQRMLLWSTGDSWIVLDVSGSLLRDPSVDRSYCSHAVAGSPATEGLPDRDPGLWLWEGSARQPDKLIQLDGELRRLTAKESVKAIAGKWRQSDERYSRWLVNRDSTDDRFEVRAPMVGDGTTLDERGRLALAFAVQDAAAWEGGEYDEEILVRQLRPYREDRGIVFRVEVSKGARGG